MALKESLMRNTTRSLLSLFLVSALLPFGTAQTPAAAASAPTAKAATAATFVLEAGDVKIGDLIDRAATFLHWNILANPQELSSASGAGIFKLQQRVETDAQGCQELLASLLGTSGFALTSLDEKKSLYEVISMFGPRGREVFNRSVNRSPEEILARPDLRMAVTTVVQLQHINATIATNALRPFFASTGSPSGGASLTLGNVGNNTGMLLSGMQDQVANAIRMLRLVDVPPAQPPVQGLTEQIEALQDRVAKLEKALEKLTDKK
jgi:hypothetical protein